MAWSISSGIIALVSLPLRWMHHDVSTAKTNMTSSTLVAWWTNVVWRWDDMKGQEQCLTVVQEVGAFHAKFIYMETLPLFSFSSSSPRLSSPFFYTRLFPFPSLSFYLFSFFSFLFSFTRTFLLPPPLFFRLFSSYVFFLLLPIIAVYFIKYLVYNFQRVPSPWHNRSRMPCVNMCQQKYCLPHECSALLQAYCKRVMMTSYPSVCMSVCPTISAHEQLKPHLQKLVDRSVTALPTIASIVF